MSGPLSALRTSRSRGLAALPARRPDQLDPLALALEDLHDGAVVAGPAGMGHPSVPADVCCNRGVDVGNLIAAEPVLDRGLDELDHALRVDHPV